MFGTSGVRGLVGEKITVDLAQRIGAAVGEDAEELVVGRDTRLTGRALEDGVVSGALAGGADVTRVGVAPTPTVVRYADDRSLVVTASHNPPEYNGFKPFHADGEGYVGDDRDAVERRTRRGIEPVKASDFGDERTVGDAIKRHADSVVDAVGSADARVVVDGAGGAGSQITPEVLRRLGCDVKTLNCRYDGSFSAHLPEPTDEHLTDLKEAVVSYDADLGIAHDGDADRAAVIDSNGDYLEPDGLMALFALHEGASEVVAPVNTSTVVDEVANVRRTAIGDVNVVAEIKRNGGDFGGEPSNNWIFPDETYCPDGILAAAKACAIASERPLRERLDELPSRQVRRGNVGVAEEAKEEVVASIGETASKKYGEYTDVDGVRVQTDDGWFLVRASGTEPLMRITVEAEEQERVDELYAEASKLVEDAVDDVGGEP